MPRARHRIVKFASVTVLAFLACLAIVIVCGVLSARQFLKPLIEPRIVQSPGPVDLARARAACPAGIEFPDTAKNIQYASYSLWQAYGAYVKFEAPLEDCIAAAEKILRPKDAPATRPVTGELGSPLLRLPKDGEDTFGLSDRPAGVQDGFINAPWFDPGNIREGFEGGYGWPHRIVWIDAERGILYYMTTD